MKLRNLLYLVPLLLVGCDIVEFKAYDAITPGTVKVTPTSVEYSYAGGTTEVTVKSATPWTAEFLEKEYAEWVSVNPSSGQAGETKVTLVINPFAPKDLARENTVKFVGKDGSAAGIAFKQAWAEPKTEYVFHKATQIVDGRSYLIVADGNAASVQPGNYGYLYNPGSVIDTDGAVTLSSKSLAWTFTAVDGGYTILGSDGRYLYQTGTYNSFNFSATRIDGDVWTVEFQEDGTAKIINNAVNKYIQYSTGYASYGSYPVAQDGGVVPVLYEEEVDPNAATLIPSASVVNVEADATGAVFQIGSSGDWVVECDSDWITSYTEKGSGDGEVVVEFGKNKSFDEERTAEFKIFGSGIEAAVSVVQAVVVPVFSVSETAINIPGSAVTATLNIESNLPWEIVCPAGIETLTPTGNESASVLLILSPNRTSSDIVYNIVVKTSSDRVETKEYEIVLTQKTDVKIAVPYSFKFEDSMGDFSINDVQLPEGSTYVWKLDTKNHYIKASSYFSNANHASESWLVSPTMDLSTLSATKVCVNYAMNYGTTSLYAEQMYGLVIEGDQQTRINFKNIPVKGSWTFYTEEFDLSPWAGKNVKFAIVYTSSDAAAATLEIKGISFEEKLDKVSDIFEKGEGNYSVDAVVMAKAGSNVIIGDGTANIMLYKSGNDLSVGDVIAIRDGAVSTYNGLFQFNGADYTKTGTQTPVYGDPVVLKTDDDIKNWGGVPQYQYIEFEGTMGTDDRNIKCGDYGVYIAKTAGYAGKTVKITGYANGVASSHKTITTTLVSIEEIEGSTPPTPPTPPTPATSEYSIDLNYTLGNKAYDNGGATVNGVEVNKVLKIGTGSVVGDFTLTVPAGTKKITYYAVAWKGNATTVEFYEGDTLVKSQDVAANDGATGNAPYTITVTDTDKYVIEKTFASETQLKVTIASGAKPRAIFFGIKAE